MRRHRSLVPALALLAAVTTACASTPAQFDSAAVTTTSTQASDTTLPDTGLDATSDTTVAPASSALPRPAPTPEAGQARAWITPSGVVAAVVGVVDGGMQVFTPCENTVVVQGGRPVAPPTVLLDPGHGGREPGAVGANGLTEKALNMAVSEYTRAALERAGVSALLTRTGDYRMTLEARARLARELQPRAFVSIHHNGDDDGPRAGPGTEMFYQVASPTHAESKRLAGILYEEVVQALSQYQVPWVADADAGAKYRLNDTGDDYYGILRRTKGVVTVLAELAFLSNPPEAELLARSDVQQVLGEAVARGIVRFLTTRDPGSGFTEPYARTQPAGGGGGAAGCVDPPL